jgi:hypothetical protein
MSLSSASAADKCDPRDRPGPQPHNRIGTLYEQLALAQTPRPSRRERRRARLLELLAGDMTDIALAVSQEMQR